MADERYPQVVPQAVDVLKSIDQLYNGTKKGGTSSRNTPKALARMRIEEVELTEQDQPINPLGRIGMGSLMIGRSSRDNA